MLFDTEPPTEREEEVRELSEPDYIEELQSSPLIKEDNISPFSNSNPSFEICSEDNPLSGPMLSPIGCKRAFLISNLNWILWQSSISELKTTCILLKSKSQ